MSEKAVSKRNYSMFDAKLSGRPLNFALLRRLLKWMKPYWISLSVSAVFVLITSVLAVLLPVILSVVVIDNIIRNEVDRISPDFGMIQVSQWIANNLDLSLLFAACLLYAIIQLTWAVSSHVHRMTLISAVIRGLRDLRHSLFTHLETRPFSFYDRVAVGRVMTRVTNDVEALYELLRGLGTLIGELVPFFVALFIMFALDIEMTLILLLYVPIIGIMTIIFRKYTRRLFRLARQTISALNQNLQENLAGLVVVQLSRREEFNQRRYKRINRNNLYFETRSMRLETLYSAFNDSMASVAIGIILWHAGGEVIQGEISLGGMILFTRFIDMLLHPIVVLGEQFNILFRAMASGERIFQALDWDEQIHEPVNPVVLPDRLKGAFTFDHLTFRYKHETVIDDVSFTIKPGENLAIVGPTGSGKSTLIHLVSRFYDIPDGKIFLDGIDINSIHSRDLRRRIGVVLQDFHIFSGSVFDNIALGDERISMDMVVEAAKIVNADDFIRSLPFGYETTLSERGQNLSQGQRQLLAFARVLVADPEILILDEATANIDTETELLIQDALSKITKKRTSIIIAHRLQTIHDSDRILVLNQGKVVELGKHDELMRAKGLFYTLHSLQFQQTSRTAINCT